MTTQEFNELLAKAEAGDVATMDEVANIYANDANFKDANKAFYWYSKSAETGDMLGMSNLGGYCYAYGNGVQMDLEKSLYWLTRAAKECGNAWSAERLNSIGVELQYGNNGRTINLPLAFKFYMASSNCGDSNGMCSAAYSLAHGIGTEIDYNKTFELYTKAVELGNQYGYSNLGWCYLNGNGVEKNIPEAIKWFSDAAEKFGNIYSMKELTQIYGELDGYINYEQAAKWFLELIKRDCDSNSGVYDNTGYNKDLYAKIKNAVLNSNTGEEMIEMISSMSEGNGGSLFGRAMSFTTTNAKSYINKTEEILKPRQKIEAEKAELIKQIEKDYDHDIKYRPFKTPRAFVIPEGTKRIGKFAFKGSDLTSITIPNSVTSIEHGAFMGCSSLKSLTIRNSVTSIGDWAFDGCSGLTSVTIPNSVTSIGDGAFSSCSGPTSIDIPNSVTSIEKYTFRDCSGLTSVTIPNSVTSIGLFAFYGCSSLTSVTIPNSVTSIEDWAFDAGTKLLHNP